MAQMLSHKKKKTTRWMGVAAAILLMGLCIQTFRNPFGKIITHQQPTFDKRINSTISSNNNRGSSMITSNSRSSSLPVLQPPPITTINRIKVFSSLSHHPNARKQQQELAMMAHIFEHVVMNQTQQGDFLQIHSRLCGGGKQLVIDRRWEELIRLQQFHLACQIWNYCALYVHGGVLLDTSSSSSNSLVLSLPLETLLDSDNGMMETTSDHLLRNVNKAILNDMTIFPKALHGSFLFLSQARSAVARGMLQVLLKTSMSELTTSSLLLPQTLYALVQEELSQKYHFHEDTTIIQPGQYYDHDHNDNLSNHSNNNRNSSAWYFFEQTCHVSPIRFLPSSNNNNINNNRNQSNDHHHSHPYACPQQSGYCCHVYDRTIPAVVGWTRDSLWPYPQLPSLDQLPKPFNATTGFYQKEDLPYMATIRQRRRQQPRRILRSSSRSSPQTKPKKTATITYVRDGNSSNDKKNQNQSNATNLFDMFSQMGCLPSSSCIGCFRNVDIITSCHTCRKECGCYCPSVCQVNVPPLPVTKDIIVRPPQHRRDPTRIIPRIIHQTWFEDIHVSKYMNTARLVESFRQSGWEYRFYTDNMAADFLSTHFPKEVRQAYDDLLPGAFKADLLRYCVLLIHGGLYADVDILLESNLDVAIGPDVGFLAPFDSMPGFYIGHRMCLWNGFMAAAPGHPFLAKVIEMVVNHARNRFTTVEYDHMFCPNPILSLLRGHDDLFTSGPCILGAAVNQMLGRDSQAQFEEGEQSHKKANVTLPGRTMILEDSKYDLGAHRFTLWEKNLVVASTDFPDSNDRDLPPNSTHYSVLRRQGGIYGLEGLYADKNRANEDLRFIVATTT